MCRQSLIFQRFVNTKPSNEELINWFHYFVKNTSTETIHKDCEKRIANLKNMIRAVSGNNLIPINDLEYSRNFNFT